MATPDLPVETIVGNLAEEALVHYWKDRDAKQLTHQDKYYEKYASKNCPYRQKFVRPTITLSTLLSSNGVEKKHTVIRPITPSEYGLLATRTHVESKTSPHNPNSLLHYTKGEIILPRWPENKIKIVRDPTVSPQLPANPANSYNVTHRPESPPSPSERHSMRPTSSGRPKSKLGRSPAVPGGLSQYSDLIRSLQSNLTEEEQRAIDRIQQSLQAATRDFEQMNKSSNGHSSPKNQQRPQSRGGAAEGNKLDSVKNNLGSSFNGAALAAPSRPVTATRLTPIAGKVKQHYNIMEEFLDLSGSNDVLLDGDFDLDFRNDWEGGAAGGGGGYGESSRSAGRPLSSVDRNGYQKLSLPDFNVQQSKQQYLQQQMLWSDHANDVIAQNQLRFNHMHNPTGNSIPPSVVDNNRSDALESVDRFEAEYEEAEPAAPALSPSGRVLPGLVIMANDPLDLTTAERATSEGNKTLHRHSSSHSPHHVVAAAPSSPSAASPSNRTGSARLGSGKSSGRRPSIENSARRPSLDNRSGARRPSLDNGSNNNLDAKRAARRSLDHVATSAPSPKNNTERPPVRPHSASRTSPSFAAGGRRSSVSNNNQTASGAGNVSPSGPTRQTPRDLRKKKQMHIDSAADPPDGDTDDAEGRPRKHSHHHYDDYEEGDVPLEYIDANNRAPDLTPSRYQQSQTRTVRKKRHSFDPDSAYAAEEHQAQEERESKLGERSEEETPLEALYSVSQQVMEAVHSLNTANPVVIKPKHLHVVDPYAAATGTHDEPGDVIIMSPLHALSHPGKANMLNMFSEMKLKTLKKTASPASKLATVASAASTSAAASKALSGSNSPTRSAVPQVTHLETYNEFCFDVARLGIEIISMRDVAMTKAIGRGKFAAVYEAQLRTLARAPSTVNGTAQANSGALFIGPISIHHRSYNEHTETVALKLAQFEGNDPYFTPHGVSLEDTVEGSSSPLTTKPTPLPPLSSIAEFQRELHALRELAGHKNMVKIRGCSISPLAIALELVEYGNLHSNMSSSEWQADTPLRDRISFMLDICDGLAHMHSRLFVHRDIKPHNILLGVSFPDGHTICKIADLGTAVKLKTSSDLLTEQIGTTGYSAPEIFSGKGYSFPVDVFACGVLFWELLGTTKQMRDNILMGHDPNEAVEMMESGVRPLFHATTDYHSRPELRAAIQRAWATRPEDRPVVTALRAAVVACPPI